MTDDRRAGRGPNRGTNSLLVLIVLAVGTMAGAASFRHVHDWTIHNSPAGTSDWFGWANALITELIPTAALIIIAQRRKTGGHIGYPMFLLIAAVSLSLTAQLAVAKPTIFGWMVSALPSLAFFALSKLVFTATHDTTPTAPAAVRAADASAVMEPRTARTADPEFRPQSQTPANSAAAPARASSLDTATGTPSDLATVKSPALETIRPVPTDVPGSPSRTDAPATVPDALVVPAASSAAVNSGELMAALLPGARLYARNHQQAHGTPITPNQLAVRLRIDSTTAEQLLSTLNPTKPHVAAHNGVRHTLTDVPA